jgi:hypothetical protein
MNEEDAAQTRIAQGVVLSSGIRNSHRICQNRQVSSELADGMGERRGISVKVGI